MSFDPATHSIQPGLRYFQAEDKDRRTGHNAPRTRAFSAAQRSLTELEEHLATLGQTQSQGRLLEWVRRYLALRLRCDASLGVFDSYLHAVVDPDVDLTPGVEPEERPGLQGIAVAFDKRIVAELKAAGFPSDVVGPAHQAIRHAVDVVLGGESVALPAEMDEHSHDSSPSVGAPRGCASCGCGDHHPTEGEATSGDAS